MVDGRLGEGKNDSVNCSPGLVPRTQRLKRPAFRSSDRKDFYPGALCTRPRTGIQRSRTLSVLHFERQ
jgi:hypothetical protein